MTPKEEPIDIYTCVNVHPAGVLCEWCELAPEKSPKQDFIKATQEWYKHVSLDHHKDWDCHWYINKEAQYSYGEEKPTVYWIATHSGYILNEVAVIADTEDKLFIATAKLIRKEIEKRI